jgi:hypothetical protein
MNDFEFINYKPIENDPYGVLGIASIMVYGKVILRYKYVKKKDGGDFLGPANYSIADGNGGKTYIEAFKLDSSSKQDELLAFVRIAVKNKLAEGASSRPSAAITSGVQTFTPHQTPQVGPGANFEQSNLPF